MKPWFSSRWGSSEHELVQYSVESSDSKITRRLSSLKNRSCTTKPRTLSNRRHDANVAPRLRTAITITAAADKGWWPNDERSVHHVADRGHAARSVPYAKLFPSGRRTGNRLSPCLSVSLTLTTQSSVRSSRARTDTAQARKPCRKCASSSRCAVPERSRFSHKSLNRRCRSRVCPHGTLPWLVAIR